MAAVKDDAHIYTDGSCHTQLRLGAWVAILLVGGNKVVLSGTLANTTHNQMELLAVVNAIEYLRRTYPGIKNLTVFSDSQYVVELPKRKEKLLSANFITSGLRKIRNHDLLKRMFELDEAISLKFVKVKSHQKISEIPNYNIEADKLSRKLVRQAVQV